MPYITVGKENGGDIGIYYKDWGDGRPTVFSRGWPLRAGSLAGRSRFLKDLSAPFYRANREGSKVSQGLHDSSCRPGMLRGFAGFYKCIGAFPDTDQTEDLRKFDLPTLIIHGDADQIVPIQAVVRAYQGRRAQGLQGSDARLALHFEGAGRPGPSRFH